MQSIRFRIVTAVVAVVSMMLAALAFMTTQYQGISRVQALIIQGYLPLALEIDQLKEDQDRVDTDIERLLTGSQRPGRGALSVAVLSADRLRVNLSRAQAYTKQVSLLTTDAQEVMVLHRTKVQLDRVEEQVSPYQASASELVRLAEQGDDLAAEKLVGSWRNQGRAISAELETLSQMLNGRISSLTSEVEGKRRQATVVAWALTIGAVIVSGFLVWAVLFALSPISRLTTQVQRLAAGDYSGTVQVRGSGEIGLLAAEFNSMVKALESRDRTLVERADELNRLTTYLAGVLNSLAESLFVVEKGLVTLANPSSEEWGIFEGQVVPPILAPLVGQSFAAFSRLGKEFELRSNPFGESGVVVIVQDVTAQRRANERIHRNERLAIVGQMLAQITHEVRNPLHAMSLNAEMLAEELEQLDPNQSSEATDLLDTVSKEIDRLTDVTGHYLQLARRPKAHLHRCDLRLIVDEVLRLLEAELAEASVAFGVEGELCRPVLADGNQIRQALLNIIRNAVEAGASELQLRLFSKDDQVNIELTDDGPGMSEEERHRAFDPFFSTKTTGTGLGLAITRQILEDHDGSIQVQSAKGEGTTLTLSWPIEGISDE